MFKFLKRKNNKSKTKVDTNPKEKEHQGIDIQLQSLASKPEDNKNINIMVNILKNAVDNENNYNIGITGSYGSGKSSIIKSYEKNNNKKLLYISLAILNENDDNNKVNSPLEERLEKAIVNQIVHQIDPSYIPQSFLKSKKEKNYALNAGFISVGVLLLLLNIPASYNYIAGIIHDTFLIKLIEKLRVYLFAGLIGYVMILLYYVIKKFNFSSIIKFKSEIYEFEANSNDKSNDNNSYFDKHLDDILYCISQSKCDAIVFEDIDRFNNQEIFIKLKEINNLLNNRHIFGSSNNFKKIPFIYAMNDDLFKSSDKTKFFDVVIPVIPYVNGDNSAETFDTLFKNKEQIKPDKVVLNILSHYITDMRLLKNIYNEYIIYTGILDSKNKFQQHDYNQLFSLIVYKNLYSTDFSNLQFSQGNLYNVINARSKIVKVQRQNLVAQINKIENEMEKVENEHLKDIKELQTLFLKLPSSFNYRSNVTIKDYYQNIEIENLTIKNNEYMEREKWLVEGKENKLKELRIQLNDSNNKLNNLSITKLSNIITSEIDIKKFVDANDDINDNHLQFIRILLVNDFINEDYWRYLSYFHQGNASDKDKNFINSVYAKEQPKYDEELDNIEWITSKINPETLDNDFAVLNYSLLFYLLNNNKTDKLNKLYFQILELIRMYKDKYIFITGFYKYCLDKDLIKDKDLLNDLYKNNKQLVSDIFLNNTTIAPKNYIAIYYSVIKNSNNIEIDNMYYNEDESIKKEISEYVSKSSMILTNDYIMKDDYTYLENFNIKFENLNYIDKENLEESKLERFLSYIFQKDLYEVNEININYIVDNYFRLKANELFKDKSNYEIYLHNLDYKTESLNEFIKFLNLNTNDSIKFSYSEDIEKLIINNENVSIDDVITFLEKYEIIIDDISNIREDLWNDLVEHSLIKPIWENIIIFYNKFKDNKAEISKVEAVIKEFLLENKMLDKLDTNSNTALFNLIIKDEIEKEKFLNIIQTFEKCDKIPIIIQININNMQELLKNKIFSPTKENFDVCYNKYRNIFHYFVLNNIQLYIEYINSYIISKEQLEHIVNVNSIDIDTLFIIVHHYFANNSYASYRDIKINNTELLEKIFTSEIDKTIKVTVFKSNIDNIIKDKKLFFDSLLSILDNDVYNNIEMLSQQNSAMVELAKFNSSNGILSLLIEKNILVKKEHTQHIELSVSETFLHFFKKSDIM
ncbi:MAG: hypothetical protein MSA07_08770 [Mucispirillum sp.]|nr:hypothetical protein [Mucispirillum sp.]